MWYRCLLVLLMLAGFAGGFGIRRWRGSGAARVTTEARFGAAGPAGERAARLPSRDQSVHPDPDRTAPGVGLPETVESVLGSHGLELSERIGRFVPQATIAELERLFVGLKEYPTGVADDLKLTVFLRWMELDPAGGLEFAAQHGAGRLAWRAWGQVDGEAALAAAGQRESRSPGRAVLEGMACADPAKARVLINAHPEWAGDEASLNAAAGLMRTDPAAGATQWAAWAELDSSEEIRAWVRRAPEDALAWARGLADHQVRTDAMKLVLSRWGQTDPQQAGSAILQLPEGRLKRGLFADHAGLLASAGDLAAARRWIDDHAATATLRSESLREIARVQANTDPLAALDTLRDVDWSLTGAERRAHQIVSPEGSDSELWAYEIGALESIASKTPVEAMAFVAELPETAPVDEMARQVFHRWLGVDSLAASEWLAQQPDGPTKVSSTRQLVFHLINTQNDIDSAAHWALTLPPETDGTPAIERLLLEWRGWLERARAAIDSLPLTPDERQRLHDLLPTQE